MTPERWQQIEKIYHSALVLEESRRKTFLEETCSGDQTLRQEVESLLRSNPSADHFIEEPALEVAAKTFRFDVPQSLVGKQLGSYQILSLLGSGGMGVVYKARDIRLKRFVAIKVLPADQMSDPERKRRFIQEARSASALNHPNIITIYDMGNQDGLDFIVMEYVSGKTLDERIPRKGMKLNEALKVAIQTADALAKAHSAGIVHRDLKPTNVMVTEDGLVKVLDFGLAKLTVVGSDEGGATTTLLKTEEGTVVGTTSYMSPEQAEGKPVDARSDIFSFGAVLYEMVTGQKAFQGETKLLTLAAIANQEPKPVSQLAPTTPRDLEKIINRCLRKDPARRFHYMQDLKVELEELKEESDSGVQTSLAAPSGGGHRKLIWSALVLVLLVAAGLVAVRWDRSAKTVEAPLTAVPFTTYPGEERQPTFSPDGNQVAFSWNGEKQDNFDIWVKLIGSGTQLRLTTAPEEDTCPAWSPDGRFIAFIRAKPVRKGSVYVVSPLGPPERRVAEVGGLSKLAWTPDGKSLIVTDRNSEGEPLGLFLLTVESGEKRRLTSPPQKQFVDSEPAFSPDGHALSFIREVAVGVTDIYLLTLASDFRPIGEPKRLTFENQVTFSPVWTLDGREVVFSSGPYLGPNLFRIPASGSGKPQRLGGFGEGGSELAISRRAERLVYTRELVDINICRLEVPGPHGKMSLPEKLISSTRVDAEAQFSPDGKKVVFNSNRTGNSEVWICDSDGSNAQPLTSLGDYCGSPSWSPDGERIAFDSLLERQWEIYVISINGGKAKRLTTNPASDALARWSRDGKWIYFSSDRSGKDQIWKIPARGGEAIQVTRNGGFEASESADGQWVYYTKSDGASSLWKMPVNGGEESQVLESVDARAFAVVNEGIYFVPKSDSAPRHSLQFFNFDSKRIRSIATIENPIGGYLSVSPDGRWILYSQVDQQGSDLILVENFR